MDDGRGLEGTLTFGKCVEGKIGKEKLKGRV